MLLRCSESSLTAGVVANIFQCPLLAISGLFEVVPRMSALPPKADIGEGIAECPLMTRSGHWLVLGFNGRAVAVQSELELIVAESPPGKGGGS